MATQKSATSVTGQSFKRFWNDPSVWVHDMYVDDALLKIDGASVSTENLEVDSLKDEAVVSIECGVFVVPGEVLPKGHIFAGRDDGELEDLLSAWVASGSDVDGLRARQLARREQILAMSMPQLIEEMVSMEAEQSGPNLVVDAVFFGELRRRIERQTTAMAYQADCAAATIESMPASWSASTKTRFINLAQNALDGLLDRFQPRNSLAYTREFPFALKRLEGAIPQAKDEMAKIAEAKASKNLKPAQASDTSTLDASAEEGADDRPRG